MNSIGWIPPNPIRHSPPYWLSLLTGKLITKWQKENLLKEGNILCSSAAVFSNLGNYYLSVCRRPGAQPPPGPSMYISLPGIWIPASTPFSPCLARMLRALPHSRMVGLRSICSGARQTWVQGCTLLYWDFLEHSRRPLFVRLSSPVIAQSLCDSETVTETGRLCFFTVLWSPASSPLDAGFCPGPERRAARRCSIFLPHLHILPFLGTAITPASSPQRNFFLFLARHNYVWKWILIKWQGYVLPTFFFFFF